MLAPSAEPQLMGQKMYRCQPYSREHGWISSNGLEGGSVSVGRTDGPRDRRMEATAILKSVMIIVA